MRSSRSYLNVVQRCKTYSRWRKVRFTHTSVIKSANMNNESSAQVHREERSNSCHDFYCKTYLLLPKHWLFETLSFNKRNWYNAVRIAPVNSSYLSFVNVTYLRRRRRRMSVSPMHLDVFTGETYCLKGLLKETTLLLSKIICNWTLVPLLYKKIFTIINQGNFSWQSLD